MLAPSQVSLADLPRLHKGDRPQAEFKQTPEDFQVIELEKPGLIQIFVQKK